MPLVPAYIRDLDIYIPGKPVEEARRERNLSRVIKLSSNENCLGPSPRAMAALRQSMENIHRYPDAFGFTLRNKLADTFNLKIDNVVLGAGSEGIMSTILRTFLLLDDEIVTAANSFIGFRVLVTATGRTVHWVPMKDHHYDLEAMAGKINDYTKIVYIANPDNPMGTYITRAEFDAFYEHIPERVLIILDEAYFEFTHELEDFPDSMTYRYDNVITLRTFSKAYGLAGIRIGYGFAHDMLISNLMKVKVPFEPSYSAQVAGYAALDDVEFLERTRSLNRAGKETLMEGFHSLGIHTIPSATNFITTVWDSADQARDITDKLMDHGLLVRHLDSFGWPNCIRISIGLEHENDQLIKTLKQML